MDIKISEWQDRRSHSSHRSYSCIFGNCSTRENAQLVTSLQTSCYRSVHKLSTSCLRTACSHFVVTTLKQAWWHYQPCYKTVLTTLLQSRYNKDVTRLSTQGCNNLVISSMDLSEQPCNKSDNFDKVVTSCQQVVPHLLTTCDKQCEYILLTACWQTCYKMWDFCVCTAHLIIYIWIFAQYK